MFTQKRSKSIVVIINVLILTAIFLSSCGEKNPVKPAQHELVGSWETVSKTLYWGDISNPDSIEVTDYDPDSYIETWTFDPDSAFMIKETFGGNPLLGLSFEGTWFTTGNQLMVSYEMLGKDIYHVWIYEVNGKKLAITRQYDPGFDKKNYDYLKIVLKKI